jgi:ATP-dependent helicase/nuclease subunit A
MPTPTPEQQEAIQTQDRSLAVEAGAGTGKTWVLVERFTHLLDVHPEWPLDAIIAITFTEKAAREMRDRVRRAIEERAARPDASSVWGTRRRQLDRLQISTVHSLCARILRENAIAAAIDPSFEVLDEQEAQLLQAEAIRQTITELVERDSPALELLAWLRVQDLKAEMGRLLARRGTVQHLFEELPDEQTILACWQAGLDEMRQSIWTSLLGEYPLLQEALEEIPRLGSLPAADKLTPTVELAQEGCRLWAANSWGAAIACWKGINLRGGSKKNWGEERLSWLKNALKALREAAKELEKAGVGVEFGPAEERAVQALHLWRELWTTLEQVYARLKEERHVLDFDDLELLTVRLLEGEGSQDARIQAYLANIRHVMVDEYQDTNPLQWRIISALAPLAQPGRLFVVGDPKQSIYRFRQAQVSIFNRTVAELQGLTGHPPARLSVSFRSHELLVSALNHLFDQLLQPANGVAHTEHEAPPGPLQAVRNPTTDGPSVEIILLPRKDPAGETIVAEQARLWEADLLAQRLLELESSGYTIWDKETGEARPFRFSDAAVLFRATTYVPLYEERFKAAGLPYLTISGRGYYDRPEVKDLLSLLAVVHNPGDDLSLAAALRSPLFSLSDETLYRLRWCTTGGEWATEPIPLIQALATPPPTDQPNQVAHGFSVLSELLKMAGQVDVWRLLDHALERTGYLATLTLAEQAEKSQGRLVGNVRKFLAMARDRGSADISEFLRRVQDLQAAEAREGQVEGRQPESGAVQLMSIHAAKGLEFPVVAVVDLGRSLQQTRSRDRIFHDPTYGVVCQIRNEQGDWEESAGLYWARWMEQTLEGAENRRLLYVACTRAADLLLLSGQLGTKNSWLHHILEAWEISDDGDEEEILSIDSFQVRVVRPTFTEPVDVDVTVPRGSHPGLETIPALAEPLSTISSPAQIAVTRLAQALARDPDELPQVYPAVRRDEATGSRRRVPGYLIGNLAHQLLADWECLTWPQARLRSHIRQTARGVGILHEDEIAVATRRVLKMLKQLKSRPLYSDIQAAAERVTEAPFTLQTRVGTLHGVIDLLFLDSAGQWQLVDWKTEWVAPGPSLYDAARSHLSQLAVYAEAARQILGRSPLSQICFLAAGAAIYPFLEETLRQAWTELLSSGDTAPEKSE